MPSVYESIKIKSPVLAGLSGKRELLRLMPEYEIRLTKEALKDLKKHPPRLKIKLKEILQNRIAINPYSGKKLIGDLSGFYSTRLSYKDRIVYSVDDTEDIVYIHRVKTHYGD